MTSISKRHHHAFFQAISTDALLAELGRREFGVTVQQRFLRYGCLELDRATRHATYRGERKKLSPRKFELLVKLAEILSATSRFVSASELAVLLYRGWTEREAFQSIHTYISKIRGAFPDLIETRHEGGRLAYGLNPGEPE